jgi:hypothetical protein
MSILRDICEVAVFPAKSITLKMTSYRPSYRVFGPFPHVTPVSKDWDTLPVTPDVASEAVADKSTAVVNHPSCASFPAAETMMSGARVSTETVSVFEDIFPATSSAVAMTE